MIGSSHVDLASRETKPISAWNMSKNHSIDPRKLSFLSISGLLTVFHLTLFFLFDTGEPPLITSPHPTFLRSSPIRGYTHVCDTTILSNRIVQLELVISRIITRVDNPVAYTDLLHGFKGPLPIYRPGDLAVDIKGSDETSKYNSYNGKAGSYSRTDRAERASRSETEHEQEDEAVSISEVRFGHDYGLEPGPFLAVGAEDQSVRAGPSMSRLAEESNSNSDSGRHRSGNGAPQDQHGNQQTNWDQGQDQDHESAFVGTTDTMMDMTTWTPTAPDPGEILRRRIAGQVGLISHANNSAYDDHGGQEDTNRPAVHLENGRVAGVVE